MSQTGAPRRARARRRRGRPWLWGCGVWSVCVCVCACVWKEARRRVERESAIGCRSVLSVFFSVLPPSFLTAPSTRQRKRQRHARVHKAQTHYFFCLPSLWPLLFSFHAPQDCPPASPHLQAPHPTHPPEPPPHAVAGRHGEDARLHGSLPGRDKSGPRRRCRGAPRRPAARRAAGARLETPPTPPTRCRPHRRGRRAVRSKRARVCVRERLFLQQQTERKHVFFSLSSVHFPNAPAGTRDT